MSVIPLVKATKKPASKKSSGSKASGASKPKNTGSHVYMPSPAGLGKPPKEGDVVEFHHPKHGRKHRGRVTAVGQDGYRARIADGSGLDVPHTHHLAVLPTGDFGSEKGLSPQDAKEAFLGPTKEGGLPATDMQVAILDVMAQHGFPIDEEAITKLNYDDAQKIISKFVMDDMSGERSSGPASADMQPGGAEPKDGTDSGAPQDGPPEQDEPQESEGQGDEESAPEPGSGLPEDAEPEGNSNTPTPDIGQPPGPDDQEDDEDAAKDGTGGSVDLRGPAGNAPTSEEAEEQQVDPEVLAAIQKLITALELSSESAGKKAKEHEKPIVGKDSKTNKPKLKSA